MKNLHFLVEGKLSICYNYHGYILGLRGNVIKLRKSEEFYVCKNIRLFFSAINYKKLDKVVKKCGEAL
jgi:hypothetical protein